MILDPCAHGEANRLACPECLEGRPDEPTRTNERLAELRRLDTPSFAAIVGGRKR